MAIVYLHFDQSLAGGFDDLDGLLCVQQRLKFKSSWNEMVIIEQELLSYPSEITCQGDVAVRKSFALSSK